MRLGAGDRNDTRSEAADSPHRTGLVRRIIFGGNRYDLAEFAGAFGDLGTFIPFVMAYITVIGMDPVGILLSFGLFKIFVGLCFKTPVPVQPMKAIGGAAIGHAETITHGMIWGAGIFSAVFWGVMALTGAITWLEKITAKPVMQGIMLGLGLSFVIEGLGLATDQPFLGIAAAVITLLFMSNQRLPAMLLLLAFGIIYSIATNPTVIGDLSRTTVQFRLPELTWGKITWSDLLLGTLILGLPQAPLTLGNAILGTVAENNALFPDRPAKVRTIALDHGLMNAVSAAIGGVPICHGAGGMAGHVRFGARTGGSLVIMGVLVTLLGLFLSDSVVVLFALVPKAVLGVMLLFAGVQLASTVGNGKWSREDVYVMVATAGLAIVNMGVAFVAGVLLYYAVQKRIVKL